jgi:cell division protein FtsB
MMVFGQVRAGFVRSLTRMKLSRLVLPLCGGALMYCLLSLLQGPSGLAIYQALEARKSAMEARLAEIEAANAQLRGTIEAFTKDRETLILEARSLGYFADDEGVVRIEGQPKLAESPLTAPEPLIDDGERLNEAMPGHAVSDQAVPGQASSLLVSLGLGLFIFIVMGGGKANRARYEKRRTTGA